MRLLALTPAHVGPEEVDRRQARYDRFARGGLTITVHDQPDRPDVPHSFDTAELVAAADACVLEQATSLQLEPDQVLLPDCVLDTSLEALEAAGLPVQGLMRITASVLSGLGVHYGAVARNPAVADALDSRLRGYDTTGHYVGIAVLDLPSSAVSDTARWNAALAEHVSALAGRGAQAVINGCSAVDVTAGPFAAAVIDPTELAIRMLAVAEQLGLQPAVAAGAGMLDAVGAGER